MAGTVLSVDNAAGHETKHPSLCSNEWSATRQAKHRTQALLEAPLASHSSRSTQKTSGHGQVTPTSRLLLVILIVSALIDWQNKRSFSPKRDSGGPHLQLGSLSSSHTFDSTLRVLL